MFLHRHRGSSHGRRVLHSQASTLLERLGFGVPPAVDLDVGAALGLDSSQVDALGDSGKIRATELHGPLVDVVAALDHDLGGNFLDVW